MAAVEQFDPRLTESVVESAELRSTRTTTKTIWREAAAIGWIVLITALFVGPALLHGKYIGPYDLLAQSGLTSNPHVVPHNLLDSDEIQVFIPWETLAWTQIHAGHLPLWNPYSLLGLPLAFNLQTAVFSPTVVLGYLFPLALAHTATVIARLLIAGIGAYILGRVFRLGMLPALMCATIYELGGSFSIWLGAYESDCMAWMPWILVASVFVFRGRHRVASVWFLTITLAFAYLAGEPQIMAVVIAMLLIFVIVMAIGHRQTAAPGKTWSVLIDHVLGILAGTALVAPLYLPGIQLGLDSARAGGPPISGLPLYDLTHLLFASYNGVPTAPTSVIGPDNLYVSMLYVGAIGLVLAGLGVSLARRRTEVAAFLAMLVIFVIALFASPLLAVFRRIPLLAVFRLQLFTTGVGLCIAVLAGFGAQALLDRRHTATNWWFLGGLSFLGGGVLVLGMRLVTNASNLAPAEQAVRAGSFVWPCIGLVACTLVLILRWRGNSRAPDKTGLRHFPRAARRNVLGLAGLLGIETLFLISTGAGWIPSSSKFLPTDPAITALQHIVGSSLVGFGTCNENAFPTTGISPDVNAAYGINELAAYDPILPGSYYGQFGKLTGGSSQVLQPVGLFCPAITTVALARFYGVSYVIEPPGILGPAGTKQVTNLNGEGLFAVPNSGIASIRQIDSTRSSITPTKQASPGNWDIKVHTKRRSQLQLRITNVPGWHASIAGKPLALTPFAGDMLQSRIPRGTYVVALSYKPASFSAGLLLALAALFVLCVAAITSLARRHSTTQTPFAHPVR